MASVLICEGTRRPLVTEGEDARRATIEVRFKGLLAFADGRIVLQARVHVAVSDQVAAFRLQRAIGEVVCQLDDLHRLARLLMN
ncbi:MAG: hypothetical protein IPJ98_11290 [Bryobacterales bacterium]|nr:hypothetical protein [Bryobacterales bacterium]